MQNFPLLVIKFILENIKTASNPWLRVRISAGRALKERQCTLKGKAWYVNVRGSVHWKGVYRVDQVHKFPQMGKFMHLICKFNNRDYRNVSVTKASAVAKNAGSKPLQVDDLK